MGSHRAFSCTTYCSPLTVPLPFLNSKLGLPVETASSNSPPKDCVPTSPQVAGQTHTNTHPQRYTVFFWLNVCFLFGVSLQKRQSDFDFIDPLAPKKARISHLSNRGPAASSSSSDRREDEGINSSKRSSLPPNVSSGPPTHLPISSHPPAPSHQQPSPASNSNSPSTPEGCGTQDLPIDQSSSCRDPSPSPFSSDRTQPDRYRHPAPRPVGSPSPPPCTTLTVTSTVISSPPLSSSTNKKFKKKSKKHKDKDREREKGKRTERASISAPIVAEQAEKSRRAKKKRSAEEENGEVLVKNSHKDHGTSPT